MDTGLTKTGEQLSAAVRHAAHGGPDAGGVRVVTMPTDDLSIIPAPSLAGPVSTDVIRNQAIHS